MAKIPRSPRACKRHQNTAATAMPLRRSRRIAYRTVFPFNDLSPELRNTIYSLALQSGSSRVIHGKLPQTAKALSQVSRAVRTESLSIFYSENTFIERLVYWPTPYETQREVSQIENWFKLFGKIAAAHVREVSLLNWNFYTFNQQIWFSVWNTEVTAGRLAIAHEDTEGFYEQYRALLLDRIRRQINGFRLTPSLGGDTSRILAVAILPLHGELDRKAETLRMFLTGLMMDAPQIAQSGPWHTHTGPAITIAELLWHL